MALDRSRHGLIACSLTAVCLVTSACGSSAAGSSTDGASDSGASAGSVRSDAPKQTAPPVQQAEPGPARQGTAADGERLRFKPVKVEMPDGSAAPVQPAATVDGELVIPEDIFRLGWWDGGAYVNDPFGSTVIAGHIDSAEQGIGYFGKLLKAEIGEVITVRGDEGELAYRVVSTELIDKDALVTQSAAFDQSGPHRLVLITCSGNWRPDVGSYESNFVVTAEPIGDAE